MLAPNIPKDEKEILACIVSLSDEMRYMKDDVIDCKKVIREHADEARVTSAALNKSIDSLQFSVLGINKSISDIQEVLVKLNEFFNYIVVILTFTKSLFKATLVCVTIISILLGILKILGKI